jgi:hypothetical protein
METQTQTQKLVAQRLLVVGIIREYPCIYSCSHPYPGLCGGVCTEVIKPIYKLMGADEVIDLAKQLKDNEFILAYSTRVVLEKATRHYRLKRYEIRFINNTIDVRTSIEWISTVSIDDKLMDLITKHSFVYIDADP